MNLVIMVSKNLKQSASQNRLKHSLTYIIFLLFSSLACHAQVKEENGEYVVFDLPAYENMRNRAISAVHLKELDKAKLILDSCYKVNNLDTMVIALLHETLLMKINRQKEPNENLSVINTWEQQYPFLKEDKRLQHIKVKEAVEIGIESFQNKNWDHTQELTNFITKTISESKNFKMLTSIPNTDALFYNLGLQLFYDKNFQKAEFVLANGITLFPQDKNMKTMYRLAKERLKHKK